ncbi:uncharacterized protein TNCT_214961 [Trichonephila clavata]|uniref:Uncharacterized protein n=1 Tax=Trichonephila clavata TaxID=2740835 RepID=A0A8X6GRB5_TRICU|nr:uncharacterized protein TNCT_214961 [Trichonephila clavata]
MVFNFASNNSQITVKGGRVDLVTSSHNKRRFRVNGSWYLSWCLSLCGAQRRRVPRTPPLLSKLPPLFFSPDSRRTNASVQLSAPRRAL